MSNDIPTTIAPITSPRQFPEPVFAHLPEIDGFLWVSQARRAFSVDGKGLTAAVLDTGLNTKHVDFTGRVVAQRNYTADNGGDKNDATDGDGHGTNVGGIIVANGDHKGIAPGANIIPIKVLGDNGSGSFSAVEDGLQWVLDNWETHNISVVCMSLGAGNNATSDENLANNKVRRLIQKLRSKKIPVCIAAGNDYFSHNSSQGMAYPGIIRECVSVGAVYDADEGSFSYGSGAKAHSTRPGQITPFSQRLHQSVNRVTRTDIFAPGAPVTSSGKDGPNGESVQHGTSQATPVTAGVILLMQEFHKRITGEMPSVGALVRYMRRGGVRIMDGDDEDDNVQHTGQTFLHIDALSALDATRRALHKKMLEMDD